MQPNQHALDTPAILALKHWTVQCVSDVINALTISNCKLNIFLNYLYTLQKGFVQSADLINGLTIQQAQHFWHWLPSSFASGRATQQYFVCSPYFRFVPIIPIHSTNSHHMLSFKRVACLWLGQHSTCQSTSLTLTPHSRAISTNHYFASMGTDVDLHR